MELVEIGRILGPHGVDGHVKVIATGRSLEALEVLQVWSVGFSHDSVATRRVEEFRRHVSARGVALVVRLDGTTDRAGADLLRGASVFARPEDVAALDGLEEPQETWEGYTVFDIAGETVGSVIARKPMPAQDLLHIRRQDGGEALIPCVPEIIVAVDEDRRSITVDPPEGLFD